MTLAGPAQAVAISPNGTRLAVAFADDKVTRLKVFDAVSGKELQGLPDAAGPVRFKEKFAQGDVVFSERRSLIFKRMRIVRGCDARRNTLVYMVYSDRPIEGSPKNSTSSVPIMPWGASAEPLPKCGDWVKG